MIVDYKRVSENSKKRLFENKAISDSNKVMFAKFLETYKVSDATKALFFDYVKFFLEKVDLKNDLNDKEKIRNTFIELSKTHSESCMLKVIESSKRLVRGLCDGELPKAFALIRTKDFVSKNSQLRKLIPEDMWSWDDGKKVADISNSTQIKAAILTQLDAGLRPSEFIDLNYGDVIIKKDIVLLQIRKGKTGARSVPCHRCVPSLLRWYSQHPTKKADDPLWIMEFNEKSHGKI